MESNSERILKVIYYPLPHFAVFYANIWNRLGGNLGERRLLEKFGYFIVECSRMEFECLICGSVVENLYALSFYANENVLGFKFVAE